MRCSRKELLLTLQQNQSSSHPRGKNKYINPYVQTGTAERNEAKKSTEDKDFKSKPGKRIFYKILLQL